MCMYIRNSSITGVMTLLALIAGLKEVIRIACVIALTVGSELHEQTNVPKDSPIIESLATSAVSDLFLDSV